MRAEPVSLRVLADEQRQSDIGQRCAKARLPEGRAGARRRQIGAVHCAGIAEADWHDRDARDVVELLAVHVQPVAQDVARRIVPGNAGLVHAQSRCLADDQQARALRGAKYRAGIENLLATTAGARLAADLEKRKSHPRIIQVMPSPLADPSTIDERDTNTYVHTS